MFFSTYPGGYSGLGLLLLRAAVGGTVLVQGVIYLTDRNYPVLRAWTVGLAVIAIGVSILIGFLTPVSSILAGLASLSIALSWFPAPAQNLFDTSLSIISVIVMAAAIILLGPGAFSVDARVFGHREIIIPASNRNSQS